STETTGGPHFFSIRTARPRGPRVTLTDRASVRTPRRTASWASWERTIFFALTKPPRSCAQRSCPCFSRFEDGLESRRLYPFEPVVPGEGEPSGQERGESFQVLEVPSDGVDGAKGHAAGPGEVTEALGAAIGQDGGHG